MAAEAAFDGVVDQFLAHYAEVRGHVRQEVTRHNLVNFLPSSGALDVLDYQGGNGRDILWLLRMEKGDRAVLLDESPDMLDRAIDGIKKENGGVRSRVKVLRGGLEKLDEEQRFDVILSHGVLMYELDDPQAQIDGLAARLNHRGVLSLLTKGYEAARRKVPAEDLKDFETTSQYPNRLGHMRRAHTFSELEAMTSQAGLETIGRFGVRLFSDDDHRPFRKLPAAELAGILEKEKEASSDPELIEQAQLLHLIARKP